MKKVFTKIADYLFHSNTIFIQLIVFSMIISIVPFTVGSAVFVNKITDSVEETLNKSYSQLVRQYMFNLNDSLFRYEDRLHQIAENTLILDALQAKDGMEYNPYIRGDRISTEVGKCLRLEAHSEFKNCMIYSNLEHAPIYGRRVSMMREANHESWYRDWYTNYYPTAQNNFTYVSVDHKTKILSLLQDIHYVNTEDFTKAYIGLIKLDIYANKLFTPPQETETGFYPYDVIVLDQNQNMVYSTNEDYEHFARSAVLEELSSDKMLLQDNMMILGDVTSRYQLRVIFLFDEALLLAEKNDLMKIYIPILLGVMGIIALAAFLFTRSFSDRVQKLVNKIKTAETGNLAITEEISGNDEIAVLDRQFNHMLRRLNELIQKNYIQQLEKKETELKNLQLQINPHFLYNTLETISSTAAVKQAFEVCDLCEKLGDIFRYSLGKGRSGYGDYVSIEQELNHIKNYIFIQKARFGNKFDVIYSIEPGIEKRQILRFILQPIVENAIVHGLSKNTSKGSLEITVSTEQDEILIKIEDNGVGMEPAKLLQLTAYIHAEDNKLEDHKQSIGVRNVHQRIRLSFGAPYGILIKSQLNSGSSFIIRLPLME